ncbi:MAG: hypothetical protein KDI30_08860 [Pseudomonadales bacterium]|nr:hypothetical protein [Pseudomonadales bacterium]
MAKANSPVRLDAQLMEAAAANGRLFNRSAAETIEYWAGLGKAFNKLIDPEILLEVQAGALQIDIKPTRFESVDSASVFAEIEKRRASGTLQQLVNRDKPVYQASQSNPGLLEQIMPDGSINIGRFSGGAFHKEV